MTVFARFWLRSGGWRLPAQELTNKKIEERKARQSSCTCIMPVQLGCRCWGKLQLATHGNTGDESPTQNPATISCYHHASIPSTFGYIVHVVMEPKFIKYVLVHCQTHRYRKIPSKYGACWLVLCKLFSHRGNSCVLHSEMDRIQASVNPCTFQTAIRQHPASLHATIVACSLNIQQHPRR